MIAGVQIFALLAPLVDSRIYPLVVPEHSDATPPYIVWQVVSGDGLNTNDGYTGHTWSRIQFDVYHNNYDANVQLGNDLIATLQKNLQTTHYHGTQEMYDNDAKLFRQSIDISLWQTSPTQI